jgi:hypothetical protein
MQKIIHYRFLDVERSTTLLNTKILLSVNDFHSQHLAHRVSLLNSNANEFTYLPTFTTH